MLQGSILEKLTNRYQRQKKPLNLGVYYKNTLIALCHALEDFILEYPGSPVMLAAFQRGQWYLQEAERYGEIAAKASEIVILAAPEAGFQEHPTGKRTNVSLVSLEAEDPVTQEWHLIICSAEYSAMVLCQELSEADYGITGRPDQDLERKFYGFWTFEPELVKETMLLTIEHIQANEPDLARHLKSKIEAIAKSPEANPESEMNSVVTKVLTYLESSQKNLSNPEVLTTALDNNLFSNKMQAFLRMAQIIDQADATNPQAAAEVASLVEALGQLLDLPAWQVKRLRLAGLLHRLPPLKQASKTTKLANSVQAAAVEKAESLPKASVLRIMPQLQAIAEIITHQSEAWDGSGGPAGLAYDQIPLESRILALVADFQKQLSYYRHQDSENYLSQALAACQDQANRLYDPKIVQALELLVLGLQQGMTLATSQPKIASGIWLLDNEPAVEEQLA